MVFNQCCHVKCCMQMSADSDQSTVFSCSPISESSAEVGSRVVGGKTGVSQAASIDVCDVPHLRHCCADHVIMKSTLEQLRCGISQQLVIVSSNHKETGLTSERLQSSKHT